MSSSSTTLTLSLSRLIQIRDEKREKVTQLFEERKKLEEQMNQLHTELRQLDDDIDELEELQRNRSLQPQSLVKQEGEDGMLRTSSSSQQEQQPLTLNPDEILSEPTQTQMEPEEDILTDPHSSTQEERLMSRQQLGGSLQPQSFRDIDTEPPAASKQRKKSISGPMDGFVISANQLNNDQTSMMPSAAEPQNNDLAENKTLPSSLTSFPRSFATGSTTSREVSPHTESANHVVDCSSSRTGRHINCPYSKHDIMQTLQQSFQLESFRENQLEIIQATLAGKDCFVLMKTGGGKSLLYQLPAVLECPKITLVVSPLLSLIQDQENQMNDFVPNACVSFTSGMGVTRHTENWNRVHDPNGGVMMILVTPEKVFKSNKLKVELQKLQHQNRLGRFVIDECHCACQWGHDFRPDYAKISVLRTHFPQVPILAVTATASDQVRQDCISIFQLSADHMYFRSSADRPNLRYQVRPKESANEVIQDMVMFIRQNHPKSAGIVYTYSRKDADTVARQLQDEGIQAEAYHSDINVNKKRVIHESWMRNHTQVVVATIAFGLGINKPDVRFVLHHTLSKTLEAYYQESGRAGRDGKSSDCILYYSAKDVPRMIRMIHGDANADLFITMVKYAQQFGDDKACRALILRNMGEPNQKLEECRGLNDMVELRDVTAHAVTVLQLLHLHRNKNMTMPMLIKEWRQNPNEAPECVKQNPPGKDLSPNDCERLIVGLLVNGLIAPNCRYTTYDTVVYLSCTNTAAAFITSKKAKMRLPLPKKVAKGAVKRKVLEIGDGGWLSTKKPSKRKRITDSSETAKKRESTKKRSSSIRRQSNRSSTSKDVIELLDESQDEGVIGSNLEISTGKATQRKPTEVPPIDTRESIDEDSEFEFDD